MNDTRTFTRNGITAILYHGDCLDVLPTIGQADMVFTDPPYGHNNNDGDLISNREAALGTKQRAGAEPDRPIMNDGQEANDLFRKMLATVSHNLAKGCCCCCCCGGGGGPDPQFARWSLWMDEVFDFKQMVVWDKGPIGMGWHYRRSYECVLVGMVPGGACRWYDETQQVENIIRPGAYGVRKIIPSRDQHPTEKPVNLAGVFINWHTLPGHTVLDPFMGSGTTGLAAVRGNRNFIGIELDRRWFDLACERIDAEMSQGVLL